MEAFPLGDFLLNSETVCGFCLFEGNFPTFPFLVNAELPALFCFLHSSHKQDAEVGLVIYPFSGKRFEGRVL